MNENNQYPFIDITELVGVGKDFEPPFLPIHEHGIDYITDRNGKFVAGMDGHGSKSRKDSILAMHICDLLNNYWLYEKR